METYFNKEYKYSLDGFEVPKNKNPIAHFLESQPAAHCEFFASSAALLLRAEGVPSRYVTGYVVTSLSWGENAQWIGRNRDAHAWVEAYDADAKQWVIVEATPGVNVPKSLRMNAKTQDSAASTGADGVQNVIAENAWSFKNWLSFLRAAMLDQLLITLSLLLLLAGALWMAWQRIRKATAQGTTSTLERRKLRAMLQKLDSRLVRRRLRRERMETLHQFAARIRSQAMEDPWLKQAATWYEEYAQLVYGSVADLHALQQLAERVP